MDSEIEEGEFSTSTGNLKSYANRLYLLELKWRLLAYELSLVPRLASGDCSAGLHDRLLWLGSFQFAGRLYHGELSEVFLAATVADRAKTGRSRCRNNFRKAAICDSAVN
jgi:hypothetical protein